MKKLIIGICLLAWMASCGGGKKHSGVQEEPMESADSTGWLADSLLVEDVEEEPIVPVAADESFADFLYNFATNEKLQLRRILFPLPYYMDNRKDSIINKYSSLKRLLASAFSLATESAFSEIKSFSLSRFNSSSDFSSKVFIRFK